MEMLRGRKIVEKNYNAKCENLQKRYTLSSWTDLRDCYKTPSQYKIWAYDDCELINAYFYGGLGKIIGFNTCMFTYGFYGIYNNCDVFVYITKDRIEVYHL